MAANPLGPLHRAWRALPVAPRRAALRRLAMFAAPHADTAPPAHSQGVVIGGEMSRISGLGEAARLLRAGLGLLAADQGAIELGVLRRPAPATPPPDAALILHVNAPSIPLMLARATPDFLRGRRIIGFWNWELPALPPDWRAGARFIHEIWTPSAFTAAAIETMYPGMVRLVPYPLAALDPAPAVTDRSAFYLSDRAVIVTVIANLGASFARKNPLGAITAHRTAFGDRADRIMMLKLAGGAAFPGDMARLRAAIGDTRNIRLIDETWPAARLDALLACTDILLSLHRAEGFGLVPATAMLRGIPVVVTGWSGNLQFMDPDSAGLVPFVMVPVDDPRGDYVIPGACWAEPDTDSAAALLRTLADDPAARAALGARGRDHASQALSLDPLRDALRANGIACG